MKRGISDVSVQNEDEDKKWQIEFRLSTFD
jgi:hypothetical protein